jgi:hypothetical protein
LGEHALPAVGLHLLLLQLCLLLTAREVLVLLADALLLEEERVGSGEG